MRAPVKQRFSSGQLIDDEHISAAAIAIDAAAARRVAGAAMHRPEKDGRIGAAASAVFDSYAGLMLLEHNAGTPSQKSPVAETCI
jgi:hypothetical protein